MAASGERCAFYQNDEQMSMVLRTLNEHRTTCRFCDVLLKVSGEEIYAHSNVLAAASPYFGSFLGQGQDYPRAFSQKSPQIIEIHIDGAGTDIYGGYGEAVRKVVDYMYTNKIKLSDNIITQVVEIAKIMQMNDILSFCDRFLSEQTIEQALHEIESESNSNNPNPKTESTLLENTTSLENTISAPKIPQTPECKNLLSYVIDNLTNISPNNPTADGSKVFPVQVGGGYGPDSDNYGNEDLDNDGADDDDCLSVTHYDGTKKAPSSVSKVKRVSKESKPNPHKKPRISNPMIAENSDLSSLRRSKRQISSKHLPDDTVYENIATLLDGGKDLSTEDKSIKNSPAKSQSNTYSCDECEFLADKPKILSIHKRDHLHAKMVCSFCYLQHQSFESLQEHLLTHKGPLPFFCTICEISFKSKTQLNLHMPKHSTEKPFVCEICSTGFKWKHALKNHMVVHSGTKDHLCDICGFSTAHKSQLKAHKLLHTGDTFKCEHPGCSFQATKRQNLKYHLLTHTREKPHQCYVCGQSFSLAKNMKRHMLLHEDDKPLQCELCSFTTTRHDKLKEHGRKHHNTGESPDKKRRLTDYQLIPTTQQVLMAVTENVVAVAGDTDTTEEEQPPATQFIQVNIPANISEITDQSLLPVAISHGNSDNLTVEYYVSSY